MRSLRTLPSLLSVLLVTFAMGCTDNGPDAPASAENVSLTIQPAGVPISKITHETLHLTSVKILLKDIKFSRAASDDSTEISAGPMVVALNLDGTRTEITAVRVPPGVYDRIRFTVHKPEDSDSLADPDFRTGSSGNERFSVIITGLFHDVPFTFRSRESSAQTLQLSAPISVSEEGTVNVTLKVDPYLWFRQAGVILDPINQGKLIDDLIKQSFAEAYRDNDRNGQPD
jgi:hypothetical protein